VPLLPAPTCRAAVAAGAAGLAGAAGGRGGGRGRRLGHRRRGNDHGRRRHRCTRRLGRRVEQEEQQSHVLCGGRAQHAAAVVQTHEHELLLHGRVVGLARQRKGGLVRRPRERPTLLAVAARRRVEAAGAVGAGVRGRSQRERVLVQRQRGVLAQEAVGGRGLAEALRDGRAGVHGAEAGNRQPGVAALSPFRAGSGGLGLRRGVHACAGDRRAAVSAGEERTDTKQCQNRIRGRTGGLHVSGARSVTVARSPRCSHAACTRRCLRPRVTLRRRYWILRGLECSRGPMPRREAAVRAACRHTGALAASYLACRLAMRVRRAARQTRGAGGLPRAPFARAAVTNVSRSSEGRLTLCRATRGSTACMGRRMHSATQMVGALELAPRSDTDRQGQKGVACRGCGASTPLASSSAS